MELVAENVTSNISELAIHEDLFNEFDRGEVRIFVSEPMSAAQITALENAILAEGAFLTAPIVQEANMIIIKAEKRIGFLMVISLVAGAVIVGMVGYQIYKASTWGIPGWVWLVGAGVVGYLFLRSKAGQAVIVSGAKTAELATREYAVGRAGAYARKPVGYKKKPGYDYGANPRRRQRRK
jgi:hypothetical protein